MTKNRPMFRWGTCLVFLIACGPPPTNTNTNDNRTIEITGNWQSQWGEESITETHWNTAELISFDNTTNQAITQLPDDDEYNPNKFSATVWTEPVDGQFHYCTFTYGHNTQEEAETADNNTDINDLDGEGCGGFPWTKLEAQ